MKLAGTRPGLGRAGWQVQRTARPLSGALRVLLHPGAFLVHLSALTLASSFVPSLAFSTSTRAYREPDHQPARQPDPDPEKTPEPEPEPAPALSPPTTSEPIPSPRQLHSLATLLRAQIAQSPTSASFTLRQLHMLRPPTLVVQPSEIAVPEPWIWAEPATAVVQAFLAGGGDEKLEPLVVRIASNAVRWDQLVWAKIAERDGVQVDKLQESLQRGNRERGSGLDEEVREVVPPPTVDAAVQRSATPTRDVAQHRTPTPPAESDSPLLSLPLEALEELVVFLVAHPRHEPDLPRERISSGLALAYALESLPFPSSIILPSSTLHRRVISAAVRAGRIDLAARSWSRWLARAPAHDSKPRLKALSALTHHVLPKHELRNDAQDFKPPRVAALDTLVGVLEREWGSAEHGLSPEAAQMIRIAVRIPRPFQVKGDHEAPWRQRHAALFARSSVALAHIIGDLIGRDVRLWPASVDSTRPRAPRVVVGPPRELAATRARAAGFTTALFNSLIAYSVGQLRSERLAQLLYYALLDAGLEPTAASTNPLLPLLPSAPDMLAYLDRHGENEWTLPTLLAALRTSADFALLDRLVFAVLPELDLASSSSSQPISPSAPTERLPPLPGRSPYLYITLLDAAVRAGRTGLAERIFRHARWAAVRSRLITSPEPSWTLPSHAFSIMLSMYATEVRRGTHFTELGDGRRWVLGWGRSALRAHAAEKRRNELAVVLGPSTELRGSPRLRTGVPKTLRQDAARVAVRWDLASGSDEEELVSFATAIKGWHAREAFRIVFRDAPEKELGALRRRLVGVRWKDASRPVRKRRMARVAERNLVLRLQSRRRKEELSLEEV